MKTSLNLDEDLYGRVKSRAANEGRTLSWYVRNGLKRMLGDSNE